jgi:hypothetical protein
LSPKILSPPISDNDPRNLYEEQINVELTSKQEIGLWFSISDLLRQLIDHQDRQSMLCDINVQMRMANELYSVQKMYALYLRNEKPFIPKDNLEPRMKADNTR